MTSETTSLNYFIYDIVSYRIQDYISNEEIFNEEAENEYYLYQYVEDEEFLIDLMKQLIEEDKLYFKIDRNFKIDYECQGRFQGLDFVGTPYREFDTKLWNFLEDKMDYQLYNTNFFERRPVYLK